MKKKFPCNESKIECKYCEKIFSRPDSMKRHMKKCINNKNNDTIDDDNNIEELVAEPIVTKLKKKIPKTVKNLVWDTYIGQDNGTGKCYVCVRKIDSKDFECGHIIAECKGGDMSIDNLRPVCRCCNGSVGSMNMDEFKKIYFNIKKNIIKTK
jgi:hypothetical protein